MTWSGWVANLMSNEPTPPTSATTKIRTQVVFPTQTKERGGTVGASASATAIVSDSVTDLSVVSELQAQDRYLDEQVFHFYHVSTNKLLIQLFFS